MTDHLYQAQKSLDIADYLLTRTLPVVGSPKMLLAILEDIHLAHVHLLKHLIGKDLPFPELFLRFRDLSRFCDFHNLVFDIRKVIDEHKLADIEFERNDKFIICQDNTLLEKLGVEDVKQYLFKSRELLKLVAL